MKESIWLRNYEQEVNGKRKASNSKKKNTFIIFPIMMVIFLGLAWVNRNSEAAQEAAAQGQNGSVFIVVTFAGIMLFYMLMLAVGRKKDVTKHTRENVKALLRNDEEVDLFDAQMSEAPIKEVTIGLNTTVFLTQDYVGKKWLSSTNDLQYTFVRRTDIAFFNSSKTKSASANPLRASYFFDIRNANLEVIMNGLAENSDLLTELKELLKLAQPAVVSN